MTKLVDFQSVEKQLIHDCLEETNCKDSKWIASIIENFIYIRHTSHFYNDMSTEEDFQIKCLMNATCLWRFQDPVGEYKAYDEAGTLRVEGQYVDGLDDGLFCWYYPNGQLQLTGNFKLGLKHGMATWYREDGTKSSVAMFANDKMNGDRLEFYEDGITLKGRSIFHEDEFLKYCRYYDGQLENLPIETLCGQQVRIYQLYEEIDYKNGKQHGLCQSFNEDGTPLVRIIYKNGLVHRVLDRWGINDIEYDENGEII